MTVRRVSCSSRDLGTVEAFWRDDLKARVVFDQTRCDPVPFRFDAVTLGGVSTGLLRPNISHTVVDGPADSYIVSMTTRGRAVHHHGAVRYTGAAGQALIYHPGAGARRSWLDSSSETTYLRLEPWALERHLEQLLDRPVTGPIALPPRVELQGGPLQTWSTLLALFRDVLLNADNPLAHPAVVDPLREALLSCLLLGIDHQYHDALTRPAPACRPRCVRRAIDAIHACPDQPYTVAALADLAGVSVRTLQEGFRTHLDTSPMAYLRQVRLARAHDQLIRDDAASVADIACRWGFTHLGRFAAAYARRYGDLPSLARHRGTAGNGRAARS